MKGVVGVRCTAQLSDLSDSYNGLRLTTSLLGRDVGSHWGSASESVAWMVDLRVPRIGEDASRAYRATDKTTITRGSDPWSVKGSLANARTRASNSATES